MKINLILLVVFGGCTVGVGPANDKTNHVDGTTSMIQTSRALTGLSFACSSNAAPDPDNYIKSLSSKRTSGLTEVCVQPNQIALINPKKMLIEPVSKSEVYVRLECLDSNLFDNLIQNLDSGNGEIILLANGKAVHSNRIISKKDTIGHCGIMMIDSIESAIEMCVDVRHEFGENIEMCTELCDANKPESMKDVCVVGNAKRSLIN